MSISCFLRSVATFWQIRPRVARSFLLILTACLSGTAGAQTSDLAALEGQFRELPLEARRLTGPLFWLHGDESPARLASYLEKVAEGGNGCFTAESRPHNDWLGPGWYRDLRICLDTAKRLDLKMWIFDEQWWPSGEVGGRVPRQFGSKNMEATATSLDGPGRAEIAVPAERLIAVLAGKKLPGGIDGPSLLDLTDRVGEGKLRWDAPDGNWQVMTFAWQYDRGRNGRILVDGASQEAVDWYIRTVYQPHYDHFADDFGKTIVGYFYDEPETFGDWGTEVIPLLKQRGVDWKRALVAWKFQLADADEQLAARYQYQDAFAEAWGRTLYGGLTQWCHDHRVRSIGHWLEHGHEYLDRRKCAGNVFQMMKYSDMGAIDAVFKQFVPGQKDDNTYQTPKLGSSISHVYGKPDDLTMVEIFGARGQDLSYPEMKWWTDLMHVAGVNFHIPHSFNPRSPLDRDCPPYFYNGGYEPRWPLYRVYADYTSRLSLLLSGGHHVCPVALLYLGNSFHVGRAITPEDMTTALQDALFDCDWIPYDAWENDVQVAGGELQLRQERYRVLIVPAVEVIPYETLAKAREFFQAGGVVIGYGILPSKSATPGKTAAQIADECRAIWGSDVPEMTLEPCQTNSAGGKSFFLPARPAPEQLRQVLTGSAGVQPTLEILAGETDDWLHVLHRVKAGCDVFLIANQQHEGPTKRFRFRVRASGVPEVWDAMRNTITSVPFQPVGDRTIELSLTLEPLESVLLVFRPQAKSLASRIEPDTAPARGPIAVQRLATPPELLTANERPVPARQSVSQQAELTLSPVMADPFVGRFVLPADWSLDELRVCVELEGLAPEAAAAITVNGEQSGGFIGKPYRLDITQHVHPGENTITIEPFAPKQANIVAYDKK
jgi:hypothetical protein